MGLIKAVTSSVSSGLGDQFKEYITCPNVSGDVLIQRGEVNHGDGNKKPSEGIITNGSKIIVPVGMAMMVIDNGAITEFSAEPGEFIYDNNSEPSVFVGGFFKGLVDTIKVIGNRITYGGQEAHDQRVYYINTKVITGNKFGSPQPKKIEDVKYGMVDVTFNGEYAFKVVDPALLVSEVVGTNANDTVTYNEVVGSQLKTKFIEQVTRAITVVMRKHNVSFGDMGMYGTDISEEMNKCLDESWRQQYGLEITDVAMGDINLTEESAKMVQTMSMSEKLGTNSAMMSGYAVQGQMEAMKAAAANENGAMAGFMGMNMAQNGMANTVAGGVAVNAINNATSQNNEQGIVTGAQPEAGTLFESNSPVQETASENKFCINCGAPVNGNFCGQCGTKVN